MIDFTKCPIDKTANYGGSDQKKGVIYNKKRYMLKYADKVKEEKRNVLNSSYSNSVFSEHICCSILKELGFSVQNTLLGTIDLQKRDGTIETKPVVACENFVPNGYELVEFKNIESSVLAVKPGKVPRLSDIYEVFYHENEYFDNETGLEAMFFYWQEFVLDALLGNFDRHANNWGYLVNKETGKMSYAPIYDCGSCLYPQLADDALEQILNNPAEIDMRIEKFPTAALMLDDGKKAVYKEILLKTENQECLKAILETVPKIDFTIIDRVINAAPISEIRKTFYSTMLRHRFERILMPAYERVLSLQREEYDDFQK